MKTKSTNFSTAQIIILVIALVTGIYICAKAQVVLSGQNKLGGYTTMNVNTPADVVRITTGNPPNCTNGCVYNFQVNATGGRTPYTFSAVGLPTGLSINASTGQITGNPTVNTTFNGTINVQDFNGLMAQPFNFQIVISAGAPALMITSGNLTNIVGTVGQVYPTYTGTASGGTQPYNWTIFSGALPGGLSLANSSNTGIISGTFTTSGPFSGVLRVTDNAAAHVDLPFNYTVNPAPPVCNVSISPLSASVVTGGTQQFTATVTNCSPSTVTWSVNGVNGGNTTTGTVSTQGLFTAPASVPSPSTVTVAATSTADVTKSGSANVLIQSTTQGENTYCLKGDVAQFPTEAPASPVINCIYTGEDAWVTNGTIRIVNSNATWTTAWAAAVPGDIIQVTAGTTLTNVTIPASKVGTAANPIRVRSSDFAFMPAEHTRVTPCFFGVGSLPDYPPDTVLGVPNTPIFSCSSNINHGYRITTSNTSPALTIGTNDAYIRFEGGQIDAAADLDSNIISPGDPADHIVFDRMWVHGTQHNSSLRGLATTHMKYVAVINSFFSDIHCESGNSGLCGDSQAISGGINQNSLETEPVVKIYNNFLSSSGEGTIYGGGSANVVPTDQEYRSNWYYKPQTWNPSFAGYTGGGPHGAAWTTKNSYEQKNVDRWIFEGNVMQNVWAGFTQNGAQALINAKNPSAGCPVCKVTNGIFRYNYGTNSNQAMQIASVHSDSGNYAVGNNSYSIHDNIYDDLGDPLSCGGATCSGITGDLGIVNSTDLGAPAADIMHDVKIYNDDYISSATPYAGFPGRAQSIGASATAPMSHLTEVNSIFDGGQFGVVSTGGTGNCSVLTGNGNNFANLFNACWVPNIVDGNVIVKGNPAGKNWIWPGTHNSFPADWASVGFINYNGGLYGDYHLSNSSPVKGIGVDPNTGTFNGSDPGANVNMVNLFTAGVTSQSGGTSPVGASPSACAGINNPTTGCVAFFPGFTDNTHTGNSTPLFDPPPDNISQLPMSKWLYTGNTTLFIGEYQPWFCPTGFPANCNGHKNIAMDEHNTAQLTSQLQAMSAHGINAVSVDWYGTDATQAFNDTTTVDIANIIASGVIPNMQFILVADQGLLTSAGTLPACPQGATDQTTCISNKLIAALDIANTRWFQQPWYTNDASRPLLLYFITESLWSGTNWTTVWSTVTAHIAGYAKKPKQIFRAGNFTHVNEDGEYAWPQPAGTFSTTNQFFWGDNASTTPNYIDNFLANCLSHSTLVCIPYMAKGFNDLVASWGTGRVTDQQAANVLWLTGNEVTHNGAFGLSNQLKYMQIATMNDYEEGTEIETGVDNTYTVNAMLTGASTLGYSVSSTNAKANIRTIAFFQIYYQDLNGNYILVKDQLANTSTSIDLTTLAIPVGIWNVYVVAEGMPYVFNKISQAVVYIH